MSYKCNQCSKLYATRQSRWRHQQRCRDSKEIERKTLSLNDFQHIGHGYPDVNQYNNATDSDAKDDETKSEENDSEEEMFEHLPKDDIATYAWHDDGSMRKNHLPGLSS